MDIELLQEAKKRGLIKNYPATGIDPELFKEAQKRGLITQEGAVSTATGDVGKSKDMSIGDFISNIGKDISGIYEGTKQLITSPIQTGKAIAEAQLQDTEIPESIQDSPVLSGLYGAGATVGKTALDIVKGMGESLLHPYEKPVSFAMTLSPALTATSKVASASGLTKTANVLKKAGELTEPTMVIKAPVKATVKGVANIPPLKALPVNLYASALKPKFPTGSDTLENVLKATEHNLDKGRVVSQNVWRKTQTAINDYKNSVKQILTQGRGKDWIDIEEVVKPLDNLINDDAFKDWKPDLLTRVVERTKQNLIKYHSDRSMGYLTPEEVQAIKVKQWQDLEKDFGQVSLVYKDAVQKALGRGAKESLEKLYPQLKDINIAEGELLSFNRHLESALKSHLRSDEVRNLAFVVKAIIDNPTAKSQLAIWLRRAQKNNPLANPRALEKSLIFNLGRLSTQQGDNNAVQNQE